MNKTQIRLILIYAIALAILIFIILPLTVMFGRYSAIAVIAIPFGIGFITALITAVWGRRRMGKIFLFSLVPIALSILSLILIAQEGAICLLIFGLILLLPYFGGIMVGFMVQSKLWMRNTVSMVVLAAILMSSTTLPDFNKSKSVEDAVVVNASAEQVWQVISHKTTFGTSDEFFFRNGVSYPNAMQLCQDSAGAYLKCSYNNGDVSAPVSEIRPNRGFTFSFPDSLVSMRETNFYNNPQTMHLRNHFVVNYGSFDIEPLSDTTCRLIATTNFRHKFEPEIYTNKWVSYFLGKMHTHVLTRIKAAAEVANRQ